MSILCQKAFTNLQQFFLLDGPICYIFKTAELIPLWQWRSWLFFTAIMTLRVSDWQSESDLDSVRNSCDVFYHKDHNQWQSSVSPPPTLTSFSVPWHWLMDRRMGPTLSRLVIITENEKDYNRKWERPILRMRKIIIEMTLMFIVQALPFFTASQQYHLVSRFIIITIIIIVIIIIIIIISTSFLGQGM